MRFIENIKSSYGSDAEEMDRGDLIQTVLITALFVAATIAVGTWLITAISNKGADVASCIEGSNTYSAGETSENCEEADGSHASTDSFKNENSYKDRY